MTPDQLRFADTMNWAYNQIWDSKQQGRLDFVEVCATHEDAYSHCEMEGPDDVSPFGTNVYIKDMTTIQLREFVLSGMSIEDQDRVFKESAIPDADLVFVASVARAPVS